MKIIWKNIIGFEGLYQINNIGQVKSLNYHRQGHEQIIKLDLTNSGYYRAQLCKNGVVFRFLVERLVAQAFLPNPNNYPVVNHKDRNSQNNFIWVNDDNSINYEKSNLEWCSVKYNNHYDGAYKRRVQTRRDNDNYFVPDEIRKSISNKLKGNHNSPTKAVVQLSDDGKIISIYPSGKEASIITGISRSHICNVCKGKRDKAGGYKWRYAS